MKAEAWLPTARLGMWSRLQNLLQWRRAGVRRALSGTACGFERSGAVGECQAAFVALSSETNTGLHGRSLAWVAFGEIFPLLPNGYNAFISPRASNRSISTCPGGRPPAGVSAVVPAGRLMGPFPSPLP